MRYYQEGVCFCVGGEKGGWGPEMQLLEWKTESGPRCMVTIDVPLAMRTVLLVFGRLVGHSCSDGLFFWCLVPAGVIVGLLNPCGLVLCYSAIHKQMGVVSSVYFFFKKKGIALGSRQIGLGSWCP